MNMQNGHDVKVHTLNPTDTGICQAKLTEVHPSNISWHPLLAEIFNSPISAGTYHVPHVAISVVCDANQFEPQIVPWGRYVTFRKTVYFIWASPPLQFQSHYALVRNWELTELSQQHQDHPKSADRTGREQGEWSRVLILGWGYLSLFLTGGTERRAGMCPGWNRQWRGPGPGEQDGMWRGAEELLWMG